MDNSKVQMSPLLATDPPAGYKETELGMLPEEWKILQVGDLTVIKYGKAKPKESGEVPAVGSGGVYGWTSVPLVDFPTLVVGRKGTAGKVWLQELPCWPSDTTFYLEWTSDKVDQRFLYHWLQERPLSGEHAKTTLPSLSKPDLESYLVPLPPLAEQQAIVHVLRTVREAVESTEQVIGATRELKRSLMNHLFAYGPVSVDEAEQVLTKETPYGLVPEHWNEIVLGECAYVQTGVTKGRKLNGEKTVEIPYLRVANVQDGYLDLEEIKTIHIRETELERYKLREEDVLLTEGGDFDKLGRGFVWRNQIPDCVHQNHVFAVRADAKLLLPEYLAYLVQSRYGKAYFLQVAHRTTNLASINSTKLKALPVLVPSFSEQEEIVRILKAVDEKIGVEENRKQSLEVLFKALLRSLVTGKIRLKDSDLSEVEGVI